jgi:type I restriction enzyme M protein
VALKKSDLYSSLWSSADELRGSMDASQYKDYVLTLLFVKYVSDKAKADHSSLIYVPEDGSFDYLVSLKGKTDVGEKVNIAIRRLAEENDLLGVINNADFDDPAKLGSGKELQDKVSNLIGIFQDMDFTGSRAEGDDLLGDAYEYLMRHFATQSGKSKGQFYTPAEVSRVMADLLQIPAGTPKSTTVYDPTCGSGSLLIKVASAAPNGLTIYGQENDNATWALARMNMILHGFETHDLRQGNTLANPKFTSGGHLQTFDYLVANPPFSNKTWTNGFDWSYGRFDGFDTPPEKNGDYAFLLHMIKSLRPRGKAVVVLPHGVLFRGNSEARIRTELIKRGYIKAIIGLPANLFYGTGIPACLIVLDKQDAQARVGIFMVDASKGFAKDGPKNRLRPRDVHRIVDAFTGGKEIEGYSRMVPVSEIADPKNDYNLNIPRYIDSSETEDIQDLRAHIHGGIPDRDLDALQPYWDAFPSLRHELFAPLREGYSELKVEPSEIRATVTGSDEYEAFSSDTVAMVRQWWASKRPLLEGIDAGTKPAELIDDISEALLEAFRPRPLIDEYGVYEQLMSYWNDVMHDDVSLIVREGWTQAVQPRPARMWRDKKNKPKYEDANIVFGTGAKAQRWVMDLLPPEHVIARYFADEQAELDRLTEVRDAETLAVTEYIEEHAVEDGLLFDAADDEGKLSKKAANDYLKELKRDGGDPDEIAALIKLAALYRSEDKAKRVVKDATTALNEKVVTKYKILKESEVRDLVIAAKWGAAVQQRVDREVTTLRQILVERLRVLSTRYEVSKKDLDITLAGLTARVDSQLEVMGVAQELLTGRTRLPGFTDEWREVRLGDHVSYLRTVALSRDQLDWESPLRYLHYGDIHTRTSILLDAKTEVMPRADVKLAGKASRLMPGDLVFADASEDPAGVGKSVELTNVPVEGVVPGLHTIAARFDKQVLVDGFKAYLQFIPEFRSALLRLAAGTKVLATTRAYISSITLTLPPIDEQRAIAGLLRDADAEIEALERRLEAARAVKVGMMQELLTGRTRLPVEENA